MLISGLPLSLNGGTVDINRCQSEKEIFVLQRRSLKHGTGESEPEML